MEMEAVDEACVDALLNVIVGKALRDASWYVPAPVAAPPSFIDDRTPWRHRYNEAVKMIEGKGGTLLLTREQWSLECSGVSFRPPIQCKACGDVATRTQLNSLQKGQGIGCPTCKSWRP